MTLERAIGQPAGRLHLHRAGQVTNEPPVIQSITARGDEAERARELRRLERGDRRHRHGDRRRGDARRLVYEWSGTDGTFSGTGPSVKWRAPASGATPFVANLKLTVVDRFQTTDGSGLPITFEHRVEKTFTVKVHDSIKEVGGMATLFLENFSKSSVPPATVMQDFLVGCYGTADELQDVIDNRAEFTITSYSVGPPRVTVNFGGTCPFGPTGPATRARTPPCRWSSIEKDTGKDSGPSRDRPGRGRVPQRPLVALRQPVQCEGQRSAAVALPPAAHGR